MRTMLTTICACAVSEGYLTTLAVSCRVMAVVLFCNHGVPSTTKLPSASMAKFSLPVLNVTSELSRDGVRMGLREAVEAFEKTAVSVAGRVAGSGKSI